MFITKKLPILLLILLICSLACVGCSKSEKFTITLNHEGNGTITLNPAQATYLKGSEVVITATPDTGWYFSNWLGALSGSENPVKVVVDSNLEISAVFKQNLGPVFESIVDRTGVEGQKLSFKVSATDPESDSVTLSVNDLPTGATFTPATGLFEWTPDFFGSGVYDITFYATDGINTSVKIVKITITDATLKVPQQYTTIQAAIDAAEDGMVIIVSPGEYKENIRFNGKTLSLRSTNPDDPEIVKMTIINGNQVGSVVTFENGEINAEITGFTLTNGKSGTGAGILIRFTSFPVISKNIISFNTGSGISITDNASAVITDNHFTKNNASQYGGAILVYTNKAVTVRSNIFDYNNAVEYGGAIFVLGQSEINIEENTFKSNSATFGGAILLQQATVATILDNTFSYNSAATGGGAICSNGTNIPIKNNLFLGNTANLGGGLYMVTGSNMIEKNLFKENEATTYGGAMLLMKNEASVLSNEFEKNKATDGASITVYTESIPTIAENKISASMGGGIFVKYDAEVKELDGSYWKRNDMPPAEERTNIYLNNSPYDVYFDPQI